jgi:hypothetical protein
MRCVKSILAGGCIRLESTLLLLINCCNNESVWAFTVVAQIKIPNKTMIEYPLINFLRIRFIKI